MFLIGFTSAKPSLTETSGCYVDNFNNNGTLCFTDSFFINQVELPNGEVITNFDYRQSWEFRDGDGGLVDKGQYSERFNENDITSIYRLNNFIGYNENGVVELWRQVLKRQDGEIQFNKVALREP